MTASARPGLQIFKDHGYNWIRLRLFHTPDATAEQPRRTRSRWRSRRRGFGFKFLLDYHYSDTWADPGKQFIPAAWKAKSHEELVQAVFEYTRDTIAAFREAGVLPDMVQIGNEVINGMLWPDGRLPGQLGPVRRAGEGRHQGRRRRPRRWPAAAGS